jgi:hypothetical protein
MARKRKKTATPTPPADPPPAAKPDRTITVCDDGQGVEVLRGQADLPLPGTVPRLQIRDELAVLDGVVVPLDMTGEMRGAVLCFLRHLLAAMGEWRSRSELDDMENKGPCREHIGVRWDRVRKRLPAVLLGLTESDRRKGFRLKSIVWHK